ncbi:hypothetical protein ACOACO_06030 [Nocardioides sp. CPCC 205120]|uniref:hypothetical protein n=1 Tax=Nocardioides sp. CPCC 205120 TaxID=3406462 RepID=UPI003B50BFCA
MTLAGRSLPRPVAAAVVLAGALLTTACGASDEADGPSPDACADLVRQATYEAMADAAEAGLAADPDRLTAALGEPVPAETPTELPTWDELSSWDDGERATLLDTLASTSVGVGSVVGPDTISDSLDASGPCAGWRS